MATFQMQGGEEVRFRHEAKHQKREGTLSITTIRLVWGAYGAQDGVEMPWPSIKGCKYSPESHATAMLRVESSNASKPVVFTLVGGTQQQNYGALLECKQRITEITESRSLATQIANDILTTDTTSASAAAAPLPGTTEWRSQQLPQRKKSRIESALDGAMSSAMPSSSSSATSTSSAVQRQRTSLLQSDRRFRQRYDELVTSGIIGEEEFWSNQRAGGRALVNGDDSVGVAQGQTSTMWVDGLSQFMTKDKDGVDKVTLTAEAVHQIFTLYPAVARAHQEKVPVELTEEQFWRRLFESEYYNRNILARPTADSSGMLTDDMFARYARTDDARSGEVDAQHKRVNVHYSDVDLTATVQDHVQYAELEVNEELPGSQGHEREQRIIKKYNKHSREVLRAQGVTSLTSPTPDNAAADTTMIELEKPIEPNYVPLQLHTASASARAVREPELAATHGISWSMGDLSSSLAQCFPSPAIAQLILTTDTHRMSAVTEASRSAMQAAAAGSEGRTSLQSNGDSDQRQSSQLPPAFINSHRQRYEMQAELLRHFYLAERQLNNHPHAKQRCEKLAAKLQNEVHILTEMKRALRDTENSHKQERFIQAMIDQLYRALDAWERVAGE